jgi:hypothetical protein
MATPKTEQEKMREWLENWRVIDETVERLKIEKLRALTEVESAEQFNGMDCDPSLVWTPEERLLSSGLIEQQRLFAKAHEYAPGFCRRG